MEDKVNKKRKNVHPLVVVFIAQKLFYILFPFAIYYYLDLFKKELNNISVNAALGVFVFVGFVIVFFSAIFLVTFMRKYDKSNILIAKGFKLSYIILTVFTYLFGISILHIYAYFNVDIFLWFIIIDVAIELYLKVILIVSLIKSIKLINPNSGIKDFYNVDPKFLQDFHIDDKDYLKYEKKFIISFVISFLITILFQHLVILPWLIILLSVVYGVDCSIYYSGFFKIRYGNKYLRHLVLTIVVYLLGVLLVSLLLYGVIPMLLIEIKDIVIIPALCSMLFVYPFGKVIQARRYQIKNKEQENNNPVITE